MTVLLALSDAQALGIILAMGSLATCAVAWLEERDKRGGKR